MDKIACKQNDFAARPGGCVSFGENDYGGRNMHYGILSLIPPILAVILAIWTKNVIISLFSGTLVGVFILSAYHPMNTILSLIGDYFFVQLTDSYNAGVIVLLVFIGGFIRLMEKSGGAKAFASRVTQLIDTKCKAQLSAWLGGIIVFFSDLGTPLIIGPIFEPIFDRLKVSREKLAWVLDSTSSPVAILVPFIGWGVYTMGLIKSELDALGLAVSDYDIFTQAIPFQLYAILAIAMIPLVALLKIDFSQMLKAEKRVETTGELYWATSNPQRKSERFAETQAEGASASFVLLPLVVLFVTLFGILIPKGFPFQKIDGNEFRVALTTAYFFAAVVLMALMVLKKTKTFKTTFGIYLNGMKGMDDVAITLILAWSLGSTIKGLGTADFIIQIMRGNISPILIPAIVFLFGACVSFSTGSSWGTFAIMMPLAIPMAVSFSVSIPICVGAVLSGGLFGDHCSPISDTTILSSTGAGCDLVDHVKTQLPYAALNGAIAFVGYLIAGITQSVVSLAAVLALLAASTFGLSKWYRRRERHADHT